MALTKNIVVSTSEAKIYGPTDYCDALIGALDGKKIFRSDYLDKLEAAIKAKDEKYVKTFKKLTSDKIHSASGYDTDHPFVTAEGRSGTKYRSWRYVAVI